MISAHRFFAKLDFPEIDEAHFGIYKCVERLIEEATKERYSEFLSSVITHAKDEEEMMYRIGYPKRREHTKSHQQLIDVVRSFEYPLFAHLIKLEVVIEVIGRIYLFHTKMEDASLVEFIKGTEV